MKKLFLLFVIQMGFAQTSEIRNASCTRSGNITYAERISNFPFNETDQVKLISFRSKETEDAGDELKRDMDSIVLKQSFFDPAKYDEVATLNTLQIDKLTDVIYNYKFKKEPYVISGANCYMPRNAITCLNNKGQIIAYMEICFGCENSRSKPKEFNTGEYCSNKYDLIKAIFKECKIEYGITYE